MKGTAVLRWASLLVLWGIVWLVRDEMGRRMGGEPLWPARGLEGVLAGLLAAGMLLMSHEAGRRSR